MTAPLMNKVTVSLADEGFRVLRFNFRGVGESSGSWGGGEEELLDVEAAVEAAAKAQPDRPLGLAGWSFGAATALAWQAHSGSNLPYAGVAPPVSSERTPDLPGAEQLAPARRTFVIGDRDQFTTVDELQSYASGIEAQVHVIQGSDHFFYFREDKVAALVAGALR